MRLHFISVIAAAREKASIILRYEKRGGAACPWCSQRAPVVERGGIKKGVVVRYHRCRNTTRCLIASIKLTMKSEEEIQMEDETP